MIDRIHFRSDSFVYLITHERKIIKKSVYLLRKIGCQGLHDDDTLE